MTTSQKLFFGMGALIAALAFVTPGSASAQDGGAHARPNVFFDCDGRNCSSDYYRTEIPWVNWVRDRQDADVHVIVTSTGTGAGGQEYRFDFSGMGSNEAYRDQLLYQTLPTDTEREALDGISHTLALGLARFASLAGFRGLVELQGLDIAEADDRVVSQDEVDDPWDLWVFRIGGEANVDGESKRESTRLSGNFNANRVSPTWKFSLWANLNHNRVEFELEDGTFTDTRTDWSTFQSLTYALTDHWSMQLSTESGKSTRFNQDFRFEASTGLEYSIFPYEEATRRSFTFRYQVGPGYRDYIEETIYEQMSETRWEQSVRIDFSSRQTWGDASVGISGGHFLHDFDRHNLRLDGDLEFRVVRGFNVDLRGEVEWVDNQIYLPAEGASDEEALLRLRQQATSFNFRVSAGFSFQFGSIYNNVVNNRFRGGHFGR